MKPLVIFLLVCVAYKLYAVKDSRSLQQSWVPRTISDTLHDKQTGRYYVLSRSNRCIKAFDRSDKTLWETNPWKALELSKILELGWRPRIADSISIEEIKFGKTLYMGGKEAIMIYFSERIFGAIDKKSGRCEILGQD